MKFDSTFASFNQTISLLNNLTMNTSNNVNIDLRPGTRLVRETRGSREVMWVEENTLFSTSSDSISWFWAMLLVLGLIILGTSILSDKDSVEQQSRNSKTSIQR